MIRSLLMLCFLFVLLLQSCSVKEATPIVQESKDIHSEYSAISQDSLLLETTESLPEIHSEPTKEHVSDSINDELKRVQQFEKEALAFCQKNNFNTNYYILVDMKIASGKNRFYVYDFQEKNILYKTLTTHGSCDVMEPNTNYSEAKFSNTADSHCSAKGKYKIAERGSSIWSLGIKYVLDGLESTNKNARSRAIVLHSWEIIPEKEVYPQEIALSWGCPAISNDSFRYIDAFIQKQKNQAILLWIVD